MKRDAFRPGGEQAGIAPDLGLAPTAPSTAAHVVALFSPATRLLSPPRPERATLRAALVGTYTPRRCGIATFTCDIVEQFARFDPTVALDLYALDRPASGLVYDGVAQVISQDERDDYLLAARRINESGADVLWLQHEYGIFGGEAGELVIDLVDRVAAPLVLTLHSVLSEPNAAQDRVMRHLVDRASRIMVMSAHGRDILIDRYAVGRDRIEVIPHGAPDRPFGREDAFKARLGLSGHKVLMTFGLLGPGKGLERVIEALPAIVRSHPEVLYRIVGATHPNLVASEGEAYREGLEALARRLGVERHIAWENRFLDTEELLDQLEACDLYITPYPGLQQATSGTLSYAVALGKAVISTPYVHARELLADGAGLLIDPGSSSAVAEAVCTLLDDPERLARVRGRAYARGRTTIWPAFVQAGAQLLGRARAPDSAPVDLQPGPMPGLSGVLAMSDGTGILQHGIGIVPDRRHGYCLDDNARALMLMNVAEGLPRGERLRWAMTYASFVQHAWNPDLRRFRNFMAFDRTWCEEVGSDDSNGRALWALGHTAARASDPGLREWAGSWFDVVVPIFAEMEFPRSLAFGMLGAAEILRARPGHPAARALLSHGGTVLHAVLARSRRPDWAWFEAMLGYDNPRLCQALIEAGAALGQTAWIADGLETLEWIAARQTAAQGHFRPVGSETFGHDHTALPFDQQPLEAQAAIEAAAAAWSVTGQQRWIDHAHGAYRWFLGANDRGEVLADFATGRSRDGITPRGANLNCGAESILAFQLGHYTWQALRKSGDGDEEGDFDGGKRGRSGTGGLPLVQ